MLHWLESDSFITALLTVLQNNIEYSGQADGFLSETELRLFRERLILFHQLVHQVRSVGSLSSTVFGISKQDWSLDDSRGLRKVTSLNFIFLQCDEQLRHTKKLGEICHDLQQPYNIESEDNKFT